MVLVMTNSLYCPGESPWIDAGAFALSNNKPRTVGGPPL
jgi:hypothetical protein